MIVTQQCAKYDHETDSEKEICILQNVKLKA